MIDLKTGDCRDILSSYPEATFHSCVTDPPYELGFMGKNWDQSGVAFDVDTWSEVYRVLKPGAHLLAFSGTRTHHRMMVAIEDAGFELRDTIMWCFSTGFPKSYSIDKDIDKELDVEDKREVVEEKEWRVGGGNALNLREGEAETKTQQISEPASNEAKKWNEWATSLKPAYEPITLARKPVSEKNVAQNVLKHGTGTLNVKETRIGDEKRVNPPAKNKEGGNSLHMSKQGMPDDVKGKATEGRWPTNLILDGRASVFLNKQSGDLHPRGNNTPTKREQSEGIWGDHSPSYGVGKSGRVDPGSEGGASKFFYCPKVRGSERNLGCDDEENGHPTVKPVELMAYLVRLVTPEDGKTLDPFVGSGSTILASILEQNDAVGIDLDEENIQLTKKRANYFQKNFREVYEFFYDDPGNEITRQEKSTIDHSFWES